jgi:hypothetical protein
MLTSRRGRRAETPLIRPIVTFSEGSTLEFTVKYARQEMLGLWVPVEMTEIFSRTRGLSDILVNVDARAAYSKLRRFQVKTDTEVKAVKK